MKHEIKLRDKVTVTGKLLKLEAMRPAAEGMEYAERWTLTTTERNFVTSVCHVFGTIPNGTITSVTLSAMSTRATIQTVEKPSSRGRGTLLPASSGLSARKGIFEKMARRRYQAPKPVKRGAWWVLRYWQDEFVGEKRVRVRKRERIAPATMPAHEVKKIAAEKLRPLNQGLESLGSATNFAHFVEAIYIPLALPTKATGTQERYRGVLENYLKPAFGRLCLRDLTPTSLDRYFVTLAAENKLSQESLDKVRDVLASVVKRAIRDGLLVKNPLEGLELPRAKVGRRRSKPYVSPEQFGKLLVHIPEPYATMVFVAIYTGLRFSELAGLRWNDVHADCITIDERYCRGDWGAPKSEASNATIPVNHCVIDRIHRLKLLTVEVRAGHARRRYRAVKASGPDDLVFQSVKTGVPIRDNLILSRHIKPAGRALGMPWLNWRCLRTSHAVWLKLAGADVKDAQGQMRHSRASTTLDIYQQFVPESQRRVVAKLSQLVQ